MMSTLEAPEIHDEVGYLMTVAKQLRIHGLPNEADEIVRRAHEARHEPEAVARLCEETADKFLSFFEV